jgi:hypothetical protein
MHQISVESIGIDEMQFSVGKKHETVFQKVVSVNKK